MPLDLDAARRLHSRCSYDAETCGTCHDNWPCNTATALGATGEPAWDNQTTGTPRIGDTVHYTAQFTTNCVAAIVIDNIDPENLTLHAIWRDGDPATIYAREDPGPIEARNANGKIVIQKWTPGTWHHIH